MNLLSKIKSNSFALWVAILSVVVQSFHSYTAFYNTSSLKGTGWGVAQAILFAVVIDLAILFYTVRNKTKVALGAAFVMVVINSYYYYQHLGLSFQFIFGVFLALTIPCSVYFYSEEIKPEISEVDYESELETEYRKRIDELEVHIDKYQAHIKNLEGTIKAGKEENKRFSDMINEERLKVKTLDETLDKEHAHFKTLEQNYDEAIRLRDMAIQSESMTKQGYEMAVASNRNLSKRLNEMPPVGNYLPDDKSLVNVQDDKGKIISATLPEDLPTIE